MPSEILLDPPPREPVSGQPLAETRLARGDAGYRRLTLALLAAGFSTFALLYDLQPLLPQLSRRFGVGAASASLAVSLTTGAMALAFLPAGVLSDRIGRRPVMIASLFVSALLTLSSAVVHGWGPLLGMRVLIGLALAGVPSVAMAYVAEEVEAVSVGAAMGLYVAGSAIGGMAGRLGMTAAAEHLGWRAALAIMGVVGLVAAAVFWRLAPRPRAFTSSRHDVRGLVSVTLGLFADPVLPWLYLEGFLLMGAFVTVYNYLGFRLEAAPYGLGQTAVGLVFLLYILGSFSSAWFGAFAGRVGHGRVFWAPIAAFALGIGLTLAGPLPLIVLGVAVMTAAFFAAHSTASGWVGRRAAQSRAQAAALYLLLYYLGSSVLGSVGGMAWSIAQWPGVVAFAGVLAGVALLVALGLRRPAAQRLPVSF